MKPSLKLSVTTLIAVCGAGLGVLFLGFFIVAMTYAKSLPVKLQTCQKDENTA